MFSDCRNISSDSAEPIVTATDISSALGISHQPAYDLVDQFEKLEILRKITGKIGTRNISLPITSGSSSGEPGNRLAFLFLGQAPLM